MAKLTDNKQSFRWQPGLFEMKDHVVIAGQIHDKSTLAPIPFKTLFINSYARSSLIAKTCWVWEGSDGCWDGAGSAQMHGGQVGPSSFVVDNNDSSIGYVICPRDSGLILYAHKISLETFEIMVTGSLSLGSSGDSYQAYQDYPNRCYILAQDDNYIYYMHKHRNQENSERYVNRYTGDPCIGWISKSTMNQIGDNKDLKMQNMTYLGQKGNTLFWASCGVYYNSTYVDSRNQMYIRKFNMTTKVTTNLTSPSIAETFGTFGWATRPFNLSADVLYGYWTNRSDDVDEGYRIDKYEVDMNLETATVSGCTYDFSTLASGTSRGDILLRHNINDRNHKVVDFTMDDGANKYVSFLLTEMPNSAVQTLDCFKVHTFKIGGADGSHLTYKSTANPGFRMRGVMPLEDDYTKFLLIGDSHSEVWAWNDGLEEYEFTTTIGIACYGAAVDSLNRLWMYDGSNDLHLISNNVPLTVTIDADESSYNYQGTTINSHVDVSAWDVDSNRMDADVLLTLEGSTYFTDDSQSKQVTTTSGSPLQVDIKITGTSFTRMFGSIVV